MKAEIKVPKYLFNYLKAECLINDKNIVTNYVIINVFVSLALVNQKNSEIDNLESTEIVAPKIKNRHLPNTTVLNKCQKSELIYLTIPERHLKQDDLDKIKDNVQCQKNFLNFLKKKMWDSFAENTRLHEKLGIKKFLVASINDFYERNNLDEDLLPSVNLKKAWHRRKGYTKNLKRHERYPV